NLERIGGQKDFILRPIIGMDRTDSGEIPLHYRNKTQYPVGLSKDGRVITGFYAGRTHYIIESDNCLAAPEANAFILKAICDFIEEAHLSVYDETTGKGLIRHILIRNGFHTGQTMVCLVINGFSLNAGSADGCEAKDSVKTEDLLVRALLKADPSITSVCLNINTADTNVIMGDKCITLYGNDYIEDKIKDLTFRISPLAFFQVNGWQTEKLYDKALEYASLSGNETVWDLYCGTGTISLFLAQKAAHVYGVEIIKPAVDNAFVNAELNNISNASFYAGKSEVIFPEKCKNIPPDVVVVDPPRKGCDKALLDAILEVEPERIVYVSCDSATLARDIKILSEKYKLMEATPVDMFPHTVHVETVALLIKHSV
ncbi:MAG: 23S rRNA (uracil(1939)-C(5))-methyltransferase RlmD, partial [Parasporobacterium sp.]|nr:23S rRNA (uracil(1939)-C(5))-methyltransferase RlmD [Parasporobacterium sp.]